MITRPKSLKSMGDDEWMVRLRAFASSGVWPSGGGNRPAPRQKKWHELYQKVKYIITWLHVPYYLFTWWKNGQYNGWDEYQPDKGLYTRLNNNSDCFRLRNAPCRPRGQTTLFRGSMACNCGFHIVKVTTHTPWRTHPLPLCLTSNSPTERHQVHPHIRDPHILN